MNEQINITIQVPNPEAADLGLKILKTLTPEQMIIIARECVLALMSEKARMGNNWDYSMMVRDCVGKVNSSLSSAIAEVVKKDGAVEKQIKEAVDAVIAQFPEYVAMALTRYMGQQLTSALYAQDSLLQRISELERKAGNQ